ncbi:MAG: hypothetical protein ABW042_08450 [Phenylobacterium sp.]
MLRSACCVAAAAAALAGCGGPAKTDAGDPYAGLDQAIRTWRADLIEASAVCRAKAADGQAACQQFEVSCKVEDPIAPREASSGVTSKVLAAMTWSAPDPALGGQRPASATAVFLKSADGWTRANAEPVNLRTCARVS